MKTLLGLTVALGLLASSAIASPADQEAPLPWMGFEYSDYRATLLAHGWQPVAQEQTAYDGGYPEVQCGNGSCSAAWLTEDGEEISFGLWPTDPLVVAPAFDNGF
jgi:arabinogalactan endo-1,4-beta-galactosidase